ncbi:MAG: ABC transporter ATP-binding protein [Clostridia bacterium]|nr:ABC transporter ATP-binding protein [Clostridia bacterium]
MKLTFDHISASYQKKTILDGISFTAESGQFTAVIGRNGAGKSTLLHCLTGEKRDYTGQIWLDEQDVRTLKPESLARKAACLPQNLPLPHVTVRELVVFGRTPHRSLLQRLSAQDEEHILRAIRAVGMEPFAEAFVDTLSGGERKKAFFAMTIAQDTPLVILDEPTVHLDAASRFEMLDLITKLCLSMQKTFLVVMHDLPEVLQFADRIIAIHDGRVAFDGTPDELLSQRIPQRLFGIRISGSREQGYAALPLNPTE